MTLVISDMSGYDGKIVLQKKVCDENGSLGGKKLFTTEIEYVMHRFKLRKQKGGIVVYFSAMCLHFCRVALNVRRLCV